MVRPTQSGLVARRVGLSCVSLYARRDYLERHGEPRSLADLKATRRVRLMFDCLATGLADFVNSAARLAS